MSGRGSGAARRVASLLALSCAVLVPAAVRADWVAVGGTEKADIYMEPATVDRRGRLRSVWLLHDLRQPDRDGDRSWRVQVEYDCEHTIYRTLQVLYFAEGMGRGKPRGRSGAPTNWRAAEPESINAKLMQRLCALPKR